MHPDANRSASEAEVGAMRVLLRAELAAGALGLSSGLEYEPGIYSTSGRGVVARPGGSSSRAGVTSAICEARIDGLKTPWKKSFRSVV